MMEYARVKIAKMMFEYVDVLVGKEDRDDGVWSSEGCKYDELWCC